MARPCISRSPADWPEKAGMVTPSSWATPTMQHGGADDIGLVAGKNIDSWGEIPFWGWEEKSGGARHGERRGADFGDPPAPAGAEVGA